MDLGVGLALFIVFLGVQLAGRRRKTRPFDQYRPFLSIVTASFLVGFAGFVLVTPLMTSWIQKIAVALIALVLVTVNVLIQEGRDKSSSQRT